MFKSITLNGVIPLKGAWPDHILVDVYDTGGEVVVAQIETTADTPYRLPWYGRRDGLAVVTACDTQQLNEMYAIGVLVDPTRVSVTGWDYMEQPGCRVKWIGIADGVHFHVLETGKLRVEMKVHLYLESGTLPMIKGQLDIRYDEAPGGGV